MTSQLTTIIDLMLTQRDSMEVRGETDGIGQLLPLQDVIIDRLQCLRDEMLAEELRRTRKRAARLTVPPVDVAPQPFTLTLVPPVDPIPA